MSGRKIHHLWMIFLARNLHLEGIFQPGLMKPDGFPPISGFQKLPTRHFFRVSARALWHKAHLKLLHVAKRRWFQPCYMILGYYVHTVAYICVSFGTSTFVTWKAWNRKRHSENKFQISACISARNSVRALYIVMYNIKYHIGISLDLGWIRIRPANMRL